MSVCSYIHNTTSQAFYQLFLLVNHDFMISVFFLDYFSYNWSNHQSGRLCDVIVSSAGTNADVQ